MFYIERWGFMGVTRTSEVVSKRVCMRNMFQCRFG